jgi:molybdate transport system ATP-binding protein
VSAAAEPAEPARSTEDPAATERPPTIDQAPGTEHGLSAWIRLRRGSGFSLDVELEVAPGEVLALLGPNGAGKSTALRVLAGLERPGDSRVALAGEVLDDPARRVHRRPEQRSIGVVFQDYLLFAQMSARDNVAFGLRARGERRRSARSAAQLWLERVGLAEQAKQRPRQLSGGQAQRVALARALAIEPKALLLDEPLAALDARTRVEVRATLSHHLKQYNGVTVVVTHDALDAMVLADRLIVLENGAVVQAGTPQEVARRPRTDYVAGLVGLNLLAGAAAGLDVTLADGGALRLAHPADGPVLVAIRPSAVALYANAPEGSPRNVWPGRIVDVEPRTDVVRLTIEGTPTLAADVTLDAATALRLEVGAAVWCSVKATDLDAYPA